MNTMCSIQTYPLWHYHSVNCACIVITSLSIAIITFTQSTFISAESTSVWLWWIGWCCCMGWEFGHPIEIIALFKVRLHCNKLHFWLVHMIRSFDTLLCASGERHLHLTYWGEGGDWVNIHVLFRISNLDFLWIVWTSLLTSMIRLITYQV